MKVYIIKETQNYEDGNKSVKTFTKCYSSIEDAIKQVDNLVNDMIQGIQNIVVCNKGTKFNAVPYSIHSNVYYERKIMNRKNWNINIIYEINMYEL